MLPPGAGKRLPLRQLLRPPPLCLLSSSKLRSSHCPTSIKGLRAASVDSAARELYYRFNQAQFNSHVDRTLFACAFFRGKAFRGVGPHFMDYQEKPHRGSTGANQQVVFQLSARSFVAAPDFQRLASSTGWIRAALPTRFYRGLRDDVKDEIARTDRPTGPQSTMHRAVIIGNRARVERNNLLRQER